MTENTEPSSPSHPAPDPEILKSTIRAMKRSEQRANNVPALINVTNGAIVIHTQRLKSDPGGNLLS